MSTHTIEAVVAGSRGFAIALLAPLTERIGTRPRVAAEPAQALAHCSGPDGLVVVEFLGSDTLRSIEDLVRRGDGVRVLVALADAHAAAEAPLRALGVDLARWNGGPAELLAAVARLAQATPAAKVPALALGAAAAASPSPARAPPLAPAPAAAAPQPARPPSLALGAAAPPAARPATPPPASLRPTPALRRVPEPRPPAGPPPAPGGERADATPRPPPAQPPPAATWPSEVPGQLEAADALARALAGEAPALGAPLPGLEAVVAGLSEIERAVLAGAPPPIDPEPIRRAAVMRVRVAAALATAPPPGSEVDAAAVSAFLAEIDALLATVSALAASAPAEVQASLGAVRNALVGEAIDFSEAAQRSSPAGSAGEAPAAVRAPARRSQARVLSIARETPGERPAARRNVGMVVAITVAAAAAGAYHGYGYWRRSRLADESAARAGAPAGAVLVAGPGAGDSAVLRSKDGKPFTAEELKRLVELEALRGNTVVETGPGMLMIVPARKPGEPTPGSSSR